MRLRLILLLSAALFVATPGYAEIYLQTEIYKWPAHPDDTGELSCGDRVDLAIGISPLPPIQNLTNVLITYSFPSHLVLNPASVQWGGDTTTDCLFLEGTQTGDRRIILSCPFLCGDNQQCQKTGISAGAEFTLANPNAFTSVSVTAEGTLDQLAGTYRETSTLTYDACPPTEPELSATLDDLLLVDLDGDGFADPGDSLRYVAEITNVGDAPALQSTFEIQAPLHTQLVNGSVQVSPQSSVRQGNSPGDTTVLVRLEDLLPRRTTEVTFDVTINPALTSSVSQIVAQGQAETRFLPPVDTDDPDTPDPLDPTITPLDDDPDLTLLKSARQPSAAAGETVIFDLEWANLGQTATGVRITEIIPQHSSFFPGASSPAWSCPNGTGAGASCELVVGTVTRDTGGSAPFAVEINEPLPNGVASTINRASITDDGSGGPDRDPTNNAAQATLQLTAVPDLRVTKSGPPEASAGESITYRLIVRNTGSTAATGVQIVETVPNHSRFSASSSTPGWSCPDLAPAGSTCSLALDALPAGTTRTVEFSTEVLPALPQGADLTVNRVSVHDDGENGQDPTPANNQDSATTRLLAAPDLAVSKSGPASAQPGELIAYTLTIRNNGPRTATGVELTEFIPVFTVFDPSASPPGWTCTDGGAAGGACRYPVGTLPASGEAQTIRFAVRVDSRLPPGAESTLNRVTITDDGGSGPDSNAANNEASLTTRLVAAPRLSVTKSAPEAATPGETLVFQITASNLGSQDATGIEFLEVIPDYTSFNQVASTPGWSCSDGAGNGTACSLHRDRLAADTSTTVAFAVDVGPIVPATAQIVRNRVVLRRDPGDDPPIDGDPEDETDTPITAEVDLVVEKSGPSRAAPGEVVTYQIDAANLGNRASADAILEETLPSGSTFVPSQSDSGWACENSTGPCRLRLGVLPSSGSMGPFLLSVQLDPTLPRTVSEIVNEVDLQDPKVADSDPSNNTATWLTQIQHPEPTDITVVATLDDHLVLDEDDDSLADSGDVVGYTAQIRNLGPGDADEVVITLPVDAASELLRDQVTTTQSSEPGPFYQVVSGQEQVRVALGPLPAGAEAVVTFEALVATPLPPTLSSLSVQGQVAASNPSSDDDTVTDDPATPVALDPTLTPVDRPAGPPQVHPIPTVSDLGLIGLIATLLLLAVRRIAGVA